MINTRTETGSDFAQIALRVSCVCMICNAFLCIIKLTGGILAHSHALITDGINSVFDVFSGIIVVAGARMSQKASDREHPYGHERFESVASIILSIVLFITGVFICHTVIENLLFQQAPPPIPGKLSIIAALLSIAMKEIMFRYTKGNADKINSLSLKAAAWDHRSDVLSTSGALLGIFASRIGFKQGDAVANLLVCLLIVRTAVMVFMEAVNQMVDSSCDDSVLQQLRQCILNQKGVLDIDKLQVRTFGNRLYVDLEIREDGNIRLSEAHAIAEQVHDAIERQFPAVKHIMIHVNPSP